MCHLEACLLSMYRYDRLPKIIDRDIGGEEVELKDKELEVLGSNLGKREKKINLTTNH